MRYAGFVSHQLGFSCQLSAEAMCAPLQASVMGSLLVHRGVRHANLALLPFSAAQVPAQTYRYSRHLHAGVPVVEERCLGEGPQLLTPDCSPDLSSKLRMQDLVHSDSITQLAAVQGVSKLLVSGSRDGCIKVWK